MDTMGTKDKCIIWLKDRYTHKVTTYRTVRLQPKIGIRREKKTKGPSSGQEGVGQRYV